MQHELETNGLERVLPPEELCRTIGGLLEELRTTHPRIKDGLDSRIVRKNPNVPADHVLMELLWSENHPLTEEDMRLLNSPDVETAFAKLYKSAPPSFTHKLVEFGVRTEVESTGIHVPRPDGESLLLPWQETERFTEEVSSIIDTSPFINIVIYRGPKQGYVQMNVRFFHGV